MPSTEHTIDDIVEGLRYAKQQGRGGAVLLGAGCSLSAGVPLADDFVEIIRKKWPHAYEHAPRKQYTDCMAQLALGERAELIREHVDKAKVNWAHLCLAKLVKEGYVSRVLTTNFDPLVVRACSLLQYHPAVYDFGSFTANFKAHFVPTPAVFYLHGQSTGFVLRNTQQECEEHVTALKVVFACTNELKSPWIVIGYSGQNDHAIRAFETTREFDFRLYWVPYRDQEPGEYARNLVLSTSKYAFATKGYDADDFFVELTQKLGCFPDELPRHPFSYVLRCLDSLTPYRIPGQEHDLDVTSEARKWVQSAIDAHEKRIKGSRKREALDKLVVDARSALMAGDFDKVIRIAGSVPGRRSKVLAELHSWALVSQGVSLAMRARTESGEQADRLFAKAGGKYQAALKIDPHSYAALNNWAAILVDQGKTKPPEQAARLFAEGGAKCQQAVKIHPRRAEALVNWAAALVGQAKGAMGEERDRLLLEAEGKCLEAHRLGAKTSWYNLACVAALRADEDRCRSCLEAALQAGTLPPKAHVVSDDDFASVRDKSWFLRLVSELKT